MLKLVGGRKKRKSGEATHQEAFCKYLRLQHPGLLFFSIPNEGATSPERIAMLKRRGLLPGVCDLFIAQPTDSYAGLFLEFKFGSNKLTGAQEAFIIKARDAFYYCEVVYSWVAAKNVLQNYLEDSFI